MSLKRNFIKQIMGSVVFVLLAAFLWHMVDPLLGVLAFLMAFSTAGVALLVYLKTAKKA